MTRDYHLTSVPVEKFSDVASVNQVILDKINYQKQEGIDDPFYVVDLNDVVKKHQQWQRLLPRVLPFFAVKALPNAGIIELLAQVGIGFDCASKSEIIGVFNAGVAADRIIYANSCKQQDMIRFAAANGVDLMTFDNEDELYKIHRLFPAARLVIRILPPKAEKVLIELGNKFGCPLHRVRRLLRTARELGLNVVGVSFHVGFGCLDASAYTRAVQASAEAFEMAASEGYQLTLLDIGGGFPGHPRWGITMEEIVAELGPALDAHFPVERGVRIIAEPGAYFVASALHLVVQVIGRRVRRLAGATTTPTPPGFENVAAIEYFLNDSKYGSFSRGGDLPRSPAPVFLVDGEGTDQARKRRQENVTHCSTLNGLTDDPDDVIMQGVQMPERQVGDWLVFSYFGHYTVAMISDFTGMPRPRMYYMQIEPFDSMYLE